MASSASNEITCGTNNSHYHLYMTIVVNKQDKVNNKSNVTVKMYAKSDSSTYGAYNLSSTANTVKMTVDGSLKVDKTMAMDFRNMATVNMAEWTGDISHDSQGKKTLTCYGSFTISGTSSLSGGNISCSIVLDDIPRDTKPTLSASSVELGKVLTIGIAPASSVFTHSLYYRFGTGKWTRFATGLTGNYNWTVPLTLANSITSATSATLTIGLNTYNGSTQIGTTQTINITVTVPSSVVPSISSVDVSEAVSGLSSYGFIQGKSKFRIVTTSEGVYGSTISAIKHTIAGTAYTAKADYTSGIITASGDVSIVTTVTDSRGRTASKTTTVTVYAYAPPQISKFTCARCDSDGSINSNGTYVKVSMKFSVSPVNNKNGKSYTLEYKLSTDTSYTQLTSGNVYTLDGNYITGSLFLATNSYDIRLVVSDSFTSSTANLFVNTASRLASYIIKKMAFAIGKVAELANTFDINLPTIFRKSLRIYNNQPIYYDGTSGDYYNVVNLNGSDNFHFASGSYDNSFGNAYYSGNAVYIRSKKGIAVTSPSAGLNGKYLGINTLLFSGAIYMNADQTITLSEAISAQMNGIVLVFSAYEDGAAKNDYWNSFFVPKRLVAARSGQSHIFIMSGDGFNYVGTKMLYIADTSIVGVASNSVNGLNNGITFNNAYFVLRYVYGV